MSIFKKNLTSKLLQETSIKVVNKQHEGADNVVDLANKKGFDIVINTTHGSEQTAKSFSLRRAVFMNRIFYITTISGAKCLANSVLKLREEKDFDVFAIQKLS